MFAAEEVKTGAAIDILDHIFTGKNSEGISYQNKFNDDYTLEEDRARLEWGGSWEIPTARQWQELLTNCKATWEVNPNGNIICVLKGKNGNHITLSSVSPHRGLCTYWTSTEEIKEQNKLDEEETPKCFSVEINEPYEDEPWYHFIMDLNRPECNLHAVIKSSLVK